MKNLLLILTVLTMAVACKKEDDPVILPKHTAEVFIHTSDEFPHFQFWDVNLNELIHERNLVENQRQDPWTYWNRELITGHKYRIHVASRDNRPVPCFVRIRVAIDDSLLKDTTVNLQLPDTAAIMDFTFQL